MKSSPIVSFHIALYNKYVELVGGAIGQGACDAVRRGNRSFTIEDDLPLIHFLSDSKACLLLLPAFTPSSDSI